VRGTVLTVTIDQSVSTATNNSGDRFDASLAEPVRVNGDEVLPAGTKATGTVTQAQLAGPIQGGAVLALTLDSLTVNGRRYSPEAVPFEQVGRCRRHAGGLARAMHPIAFPQPQPLLRSLPLSIHLA
jgi:hypothetical protein